MLGHLTYFGSSMPDDCRVGCSFIVHTKEAAMNPNEVAGHMERRAQQALAQQLAKARMERIDLGHAIEFRCDLYVFNPDQFWQIVEEAAMELNRRTGGI